MLYNALWLYPSELSRRSLDFFSPFKISKSTYLSFSVHRFCPVFHIAVANDMGQVCLSVIAILQFKESCLSGEAASARMKIDPSGSLALIECWLLLSVIATIPPCFLSSPMRSTLYFRKLKLSNDCNRAADAM